MSASEVNAADTWRLHNEPNWGGFTDHCSCPVCSEHVTTLGTKTAAGRQPDEQGFLLDCAFPPIYDAARFGTRRAS